MRLASAAMIVALSTSAASAAPQPKLDLVQFFTGRTHGEGMLKIALKKPARLIVDSVGSRTKAGELVLVEKLRQEGEPVRDRKWVMRAVGPDRFTGTLTDAVGPVAVRVSGDQALIEYMMKGGLKVRQQMKLQADRRTLANQVEVRKFGLKFARMHGTIRKLD